MSDWADRVEEAPLDDRVVEFLQDRPGRVAFNGLRRALDAHPESLTRSLRRLERHGVVLHGTDGYGLVDRPSSDRPGVPAKIRPFAEVTLAPGVSRTELFGRMAGRWFGPLRWVGLYEPSDGPWLVWSVEGSRAQVRLGIRRGRLTVLIDRGGSAESDPRADEAARRLLRHAIDSLEPTTGESSDSLTIAARSPALSYAS
jgi:hypothetical protein